MVRYAVDASVIVAALLGWHEKHRSALRWTERALGSDLVVPFHALVEAYAVMTRLPAPHRVGPADACDLLRSTFMHAGRVAIVDERRIWSWLDEVSAGGTAGGRTYDALVAECARNAGATHLATFNRRDFEAVGAGIEIIEPE